MKSERNGKETKRQNITKVLFSELLFNKKKKLKSALGGIVRTSYKVV